MYYRNKNISYSQKLLNPIIKYMKNEGEFDRYITPSGLKTDQKVYRNKSKKSLINYIKKEGNNFYSRKKIKEDEGIKHLIISPITPQLYNKLNNKEKKELQQLIVKQLFKDFTGYGFIGGIENKERIIEGKKYDHFHIHVGISEKYDIRPQNVDFLKRSITKTILNSKFKEKLGLKTKNELLKETFNNKYKTLYEERQQTYNEISFLFNELININNEIREEKYEIKNIKFEIGELNEQRKTELRYIHKEKEFLLFDIQDTKQILKQKNESLKEINNEFKNTFESFNKEKDNVYNLLYDELKGLKNVLNDEYRYFKDFLNFEHNIYVKFLKHQLKHKKIDLPTFLYLVSCNKYYIKNRQQYKREEIQQKIKNKQEYIQKRLKELQNKLKYKLKNLENRKDWIEFFKKFDEKKLQKLLEKLEELNKTKKDIIEKYFSKIDIIYKYLYVRQQKFKELLKQKQLKKLQIQQKKQKLNKVNREYRETKNYQYSDEIIEIIEKYNITEIELKKQYEEFLEDKKRFPEINFIRYLESYGKNKIIKIKRKNINNDYEYKYKGISL